MRIPSNLPPFSLKNKSNDELIPLESVILSGQILDFLAQITIEQNFYNNDENNSMECIYSFPVRSGDSMNGFRVMINGKVVEGKIQEKEEAKETYDDAIASGHGAYRLEQSAHLPDLFTCNIGNLPPKSKCTIYISMITSLDIEKENDISNKLSFVFPARLDERYIPLSQQLKTEQKEVDSIHESDGVPFSASFQIMIKSGINNITSSSHKILNTISGQYAKVLLSDTTLKDDFILLIERSQPHAPAAWIEPPISNSLHNETAAMIAFYPDLDSLDCFNDQASEFIFVVDRSGSMGGSRIKQASETLILCLASLPEGSKFNILSFGSDYSFYFPQGSQILDDQNKDKATEYAKKMTANMGGTEILPAIQRLMEYFKPSHNDLPRQVFFITDGQVSNTQDIIDYVKIQHHKTHTRFFSFGIGSGASTALVNGVAEAGGGRSEMIYDADSIRAKVMTQLRDAIKPALTNIRVEWNGFSILESSPKNIPTIYNGDRILLFGLIDSSKPINNNASVTIHADTPDGKFSETMDFLNPKEDNENTKDNDDNENDTTYHVGLELSKSGLIHTFTSQSLIKDNEVDYKENKTTDSRNKAISLSKKSNILCKWTSFIAVEKREESVNNEMKVSKVNWDLGYGKIKSSGSGGHALRSSSGGAALKIKKKSKPRGGKNMIRLSAGPVKKEKMKKRDIASERESTPMLKSLSNSISNMMGGGGPPAPPPALSPSPAPSIPMPARSAPPMQQQQQQIQRMKMAEESKMSMKSYDFADDDMDDEAELLMEEEEEEEVKTISPPSGTASITTLMSLQASQGAWNIDVLTNIGMNEQRANKSLPDNVTIEVWVTLLVCAFLEKYYSSTKIEWELSVRKAMRWAHKNSTNVNVKELVVEAQNFV